MVLALVVVSVR